MAIDNRYPERQYEWFVRRVVEQIDRYQDQGHGLDLSPEDKVGRAKRWTDAMLASGDGIDLASEDNAVKVAAFCVLPLKAED